MPPRLFSDAKMPAARERARARTWRSIMAVSPSRGILVRMTAHPSPRINGVAETVLYTDDLPRATGFYRDVLRFAPMRTDGDRFQAFDVGGRSTLLVFRRGGTPHRMSAPRGTIPPHDGSGPLHVAFAIEDADYERWRVHLGERGVTIESEAGWERGGRSLYFRDPDGHLVELVTPGIWPNY